MPVEKGLRVCLNTPSRSEFQWLVHNYDSQNLPIWFFIFKNMWVHIWRIPKQPRLPVSIPAIFTSA